MEVEEEVTRADQPGPPPQTEAASELTEGGQQEEVPTES